MNLIILLAFHKPLFLVKENSISYHPYWNGNEKHHLLNAAPFSSKHDSLFLHWSRSNKLLYLVSRYWRPMSTDSNSYIVRRTNEDAMPISSGVVTCVISFTLVTLLFLSLCQNSSWVLFKKDQQHLCQCFQLLQMFSENLNCRQNRTILQFPCHSDFAWNQF